MKDSAVIYKAEAWLIHLGGIVRTWFKLRSGSQSCDGLASHSREGRGSSDTPSYIMLHTLVPPILWKRRATASQAKGHKGVQQADWLLLSFLFIKQVCYRVLMQLCGQYGHPALAVKVSMSDRTGVLVLSYRTCWTSLGQSKPVHHHVSSRQ